MIVPTLDRVDRGLWQRLRTIADGKQTVVVIGPGTPTRDELDQPLDEPPPRRVGRLKAGSLEDVAGLADDLVALAGEVAEAWTVVRPDHVRAFAHADPDGVVRVVFVASDAAKPVTAVTTAGESIAALRDPFSGERIRIVEGSVAIALPAHGVRMLIVAAPT